MPKITSLVYTRDKTVKHVVNAWRSSFNYIALMVPQNLADDVLHQKLDPGEHLLLQVPFLKIYDARPELNRELRTFISNNKHCDREGKLPLLRQFINALSVSKQSEHMKLLRKLPFGICCKDSAYTEFFVPLVLNPQWVIKNLNKVRKLFPSLNLK